MHTRQIRRPQRAQQSDDSQSFAGRHLRALRVYVCCMDCSLNGSLARTRTGRMEQAALEQAAHSIVRRHVVARVTRARYLALREATIRCQAVRRGTAARKLYTEMWMQIAIKEGVGYLLGLRRAKLNIYLGFARRQAAFVLQVRVRPPSA